MARKDKKGPEAKKPQKPKKTPQQLFAEKVRYHKELESRWAILQEARVEYFRGKDFGTLIQKHPDLAAPLFPEDDKSTLNVPLEQIAAEALLLSGLVVRCDRVVKTVRPGKKRLSKWPARLEVHPLQVFTADEGFYSWTFERQSPLWQTILTILFPIFTVACCLFPVFPHWAKLTVLYFLLSLIASIFLLLLVRLVVFTLIWVATGKRVWFFPRILEEEGSLAELFRFWPEKDEEAPAKLTTRAAVAAVLVFMFWLMVHYAPDEHTRARYQKRVTNIIDEVVSWSPRMISGNTTAPALNETSANETFANKTTANVTAKQSPESSASASTLREPAQGEDVKTSMAEEQTEEKGKDAGEERTVDEL